MNNTTSSNADEPKPLVINGHTIKTIVPLFRPSEIYFAIETKPDGTVSFYTLKDARRWARLNKSV